MMWVGPPATYMGCPYLRASFMIIKRSRNPYAFETIRHVSIVKERRRGREGGENFSTYSKLSYQTKLHIPGHAD